MRWVKECCPKVDERTRNIYGAWIETGMIKGQKVQSEKHAELQAMQTAYREAVQNGDVDSILSLKFREEYV